MTAQDKQKIPAMREGGQKLARVREALQLFTVVGKTFEGIEAKAQELIKAEGALPSFSTVPGYDWATCIMKNEEMCHGIPRDKKVNNGDVITIDVGLIWQGYHLDTTTSFVVGDSTPEIDKFLAVGRRSVDKAIARAKAGNTVHDISSAMQKVVERHGYSCVYQLCGHGIGKKLHDEPEVPCLAQRSDKKVKLYEGQTLAIEIMYAAGSAFLELAPDGWTYQTADKSLAAMFEETVLVTANGPEVLTK